MLVKTTVTLAIICLILCLVPYIIYYPIPGIEINLRLPWHLHVAIVGALALACGGALWLGIRGAVTSSDLLPPLPVRGIYRQYFVFVGYMLFIIFVLSHIGIAPSVLASLRGGYIEGRRSQLFNGIGILYRLYLIALPIVLFYEKSRQRSLIYVGITVILVLLRTIVLSERSTLLELAFVLYQCFAFNILSISKNKTIKISKKKIIIAVASVVIIFTMLNYERNNLSDQLNGGLYDEYHSTSRSNPILATYQITVTYYADTMNKAYLYLLNDIHPPPYKFYSGFWSGFLPRDQQFDAFTLYLMQFEGTGYIKRSLNNTGGLAQDISDFGIIGFLLPIIKFFLVGVIVRKSVKSIYCYLLLPYMWVWMIEYPRFNYYYLPFVSALILMVSTICLIGFVFKPRVMHKFSSRKWSRRAGFV